MTQPGKLYGMALIDMHTHLDERLGGSAEAAVGQLIAAMDVAGVEHAVVLHLLRQPWPVEEVAAAVNTQPRLTGFVNIDPHSPTATSELEGAVRVGFRGLKLHPRLQKFRPDDPACIRLVVRAGEMGLPTLIDCFPDGDWLEAGLGVLQYASLARLAPGAKLIVAHAAGHHCLDLLMLAKRVPNLWFDLSYSWLYYDDAVVAQLAYCVRSMRGERILFGTDYPDRPLPEAIARSFILLDRFGIDGELREKILCRNALHLLQSRSA